MIFISQQLFNQLPPELQQISQPIPFLPENIFSDQPQLNINPPHLYELKFKYIPHTTLSPLQIFYNQNKPIHAISHLSPENSTFSPTPESTRKERIKNNKYSNKHSASCPVP